MTDIHHTSSPSVCSTCFVWSSVSTTNQIRETRQALFVLLSFHWLFVFIFCNPKLVLFKKFVELFRSFFSSLSSSAHIVHVICDAISLLTNVFVCWILAIILIWFQPYICVNCIVITTAILSMKRQWLVCVKKKGE